MLHIERDRGRLPIPDLKDGQRVIDPLRVDPDPGRKGWVVGSQTNKTWQHQTVEKVIEEMNKDLGEIPDKDYVVRE